MIPGFTIWFSARALTTLLPHVLGKLIDLKFSQKFLFSNRLCLAVFAFKKFFFTFLQWGFAHYSLLLNISLFTWGLSFFFLFLEVFVSCYKLFENLTIKPFLRIPFCSFILNRCYFAQWLPLVFEWRLDMHHSHYQNFHN